MVSKDKASIKSISVLVKKKLPLNLPIGSKKSLRFHRVPPIHYKVKFIGYLPNQLSLLAEGGHKYMAYLLMIRDVKHIEPPLQIRLKFAVRPRTIGFEDFLVPEFRTGGRLIEDFYSLRLGYFLRNRSVSIR